MYNSFIWPKFSIFFFVSCLFFSCSKETKNNQNPTVEIKYQEGRAQLYRNGQPYVIKGAAGTENLEQIAKFGGNSIRTWSLHDAERILDEAHELGLTVTLGLEIGRPAWGNDFSYWKFWEVEKKIEELRPFIEKYKNHPALLMWGVGNEVQEYGGSKRLVVFYIINKVAKMIKEVDPNHPTMTAVDVFTGENMLGYYKLIMPKIDLLGFNSFRTLDKMYDRVYEKNGWGKAYIVSEWGVDGHWEVTGTEWGAPIEMKNSEKRDVMEKYWNKINEDTSMFIGSYAFYWGNKYEATHTWFSLFSEDGYRTESVNFLKYAWSGQKPDNSSPNITGLFIENKNGRINQNVYLDNNQEYTAIAYAEDPENDSVTYKWEIRYEGNYFIEVTGYDYTMNNYTLNHLIQKSKENVIQFKTPKDEGPYRIFVFVYDNHGNIASYNVPFYVIMK